METVEKKSNYAKEGMNWKKNSSEKEVGKGTFR